MVWLHSGENTATKIDELIEFIRPHSAYQTYAFDRLADMLRLAVKQRDDWIEMFHEEIKDAHGELVHANAELEKIAKGEK